jgi:cysteinyl-tRNA synthetase
MNFTDIEDKAIKEAAQQRTTVPAITAHVIKEFIREMRQLRMKMPDYLPKASDCVDEAAELIEKLLKLGKAYWYKGNVYFDPLRFPGFGKLYGLDMSQWPAKKRRFHMDTYPGIQWNYGDFILWHGFRKGDAYYWDTAIGKGRPSWNIQDPSIISKYYKETLSIYCGGIDNLYRHHDYTLAILESVRPCPMSKYWLHCQHLYVNGQKMSKSRGDILYTDTLMKRGYNYREIRFFLIYNRYREKLHYSDKQMCFAAEKLRAFRKIVRGIERIAKRSAPSHDQIPSRLERIFSQHMNSNLDIQSAFDGLYTILSGINLNALTSGEASGIIATLRKADTVLQVIF